MLIAGALKAGVPCRLTAGSTGRRVPYLVFLVSVCAGQAGLLAMVMTAGAVRVVVSLRLAWPKQLGDFDLRTR